MGPEQTTVEHWFEVIHDEYQDVPDLILNKWQMQQLWGLDGFVCDSVVRRLVASGVLKRTAAGNYIRRIESTKLRCH